ncbi:SUMF1/EgtB/PvdO family nonheme iron enzyme [Nocardioides sp. NPDC006273]|uniref:formylglycine-generating enzyme family protein n=1 Tax=Nocardioides sp. NPDC006273 TaxID=3155598 RepID=UPI0033B5D5C2
MDAHPVTNVDYSRFTAATGHPAPAHWDGGRCPAELNAHPVVHVTWDDANAYSSWAGKQLPTATQWEKAARGFHDSVWPWGPEMAAAKCNVKETGLATTSKVLRFQSGISPFYAFDMVGNVWEWTNTTSARNRCELKGGAWTSPLFTAEPSRFNDADISMHDDDTGFRCVSLLIPDLP